MKKKMLYVKPELRGLNASTNANAYCSTGSSASIGSNEMCQDGPDAGYCSDGANDSSGSVTCFGGGSPSSGSCAPGQSADGWLSCDEGTTVGAACNTGNGA